MHLSNTDLFFSGATPDDRAPHLPFLGLLAGFGLSLGLWALLGSLAWALLP